MQNNLMQSTEYFKNSFKKAGAGTLDCRLDESYVKKLLGYFKQRAINSSDEIKKQHIKL